MSVDEATILAIEAALKKYNERYDNALYVGIEIAAGRGDDMRNVTLGIAAQDCALLVCGHPTLSQYRWLDLFMLCLRENKQTRLAVLTFINKFRDEVV